MANEADAGMDMDANRTLFAHVTPNPQALIDEAFHVKRMVEGGASINEAASNAPLVLGARAFARAHLNNLGKVPSPARSVRNSFSLTPKVKDHRRGDEETPEFIVSANAVDDDNHRPCDSLKDKEVSPSREETEADLLAKDDQPVIEPRRQRSKSIRRKHSTGPLRKHSIAAVSLGQRHRSKSRRRIEDRARSSTKCASQLQGQLQALASRARELDEAQRRLAHLEAQTAVGLSSKSDEMLDTRYRVEGLEWALKEQTAQLRAISSQLESSDLQQEKKLESAEVLDVQPPSINNKCEPEIMTPDLRDTRGRVKGLEQTMVNQASAIMSMASRLAGDLSELEASGCTIRDRVSQLSERTECLKGEMLEHEVDLSGLKNVCAALYSQRTALELDTANESSLALLANLAKRFPLCAGGGSENSCCSFWEPVD